MTTVIQTQSQSKKVGAVKEIYTQLGMPTVSLFADAYQYVGDGNAVDNNLAYDGLDLIATPTARTDVKLKKLEGKNYLNFTGEAYMTIPEKKAFNAENNLTFVINVKSTFFKSGVDERDCRIFSLGATADERVVLHAVAGNLLGITLGVSLLIHTFNANNGFKIGEFNKIAVHFNKTKTIVVCNGVVTEYPAYVIDFGASFVSHRGTIEKDIDFLQVFEDTQIHTANKLIGYLDYISN